MTEADYTLPDPRPIAAGAPYTFFLPSASELAAVTDGDLVKLLFDYPHPTEKWAAERMWVMVESVDDDELLGVLDNVPDEPTSPLKVGDQITFKRHNILAIQWKDPNSAPVVPSYREYWDRCLVDQCVLDGAEPVEYIYREQPDTASEGDEHADSGWRIRGRVGAATDAEIDERKAAYVAVGAVLNRDDSWITWIDEPIGTALMRDFDTNTYIEER